MTPVDQEFVHRPEIGQMGDCQRAVIASLLDLPIAAVPHFHLDPSWGGTEFWTRVQQFLAERGYFHMTMKAFDIAEYSDTFGTPPIYHEISGPSPRGNGVFHACVGCNGQIVHDPHPSRAGLAGDPSEWQFGLIIRLNGGEK